MNLSAVTVEGRCDRDRSVHPIQPISALPQDQIDDHSSKAVTYEREIIQRTILAQLLFQARQEFIQEKINSIAKRSSPIPAKYKQIDVVIVAPIDKIIVRRDARKFDEAVGDDYSILFIVIKSIRFLMHSQLESVEFGMTECPRAEPHLLIVKVKGLRCRHIGVEGCLRPQQPGCQAAREKNHRLARLRKFADEFSYRLVKKAELFFVSGFLIIHISPR